MRKAIVVLVMMSAPAIAAAQTAAHSFAELNRQQALKEGDTVLITCVLEEGGQYTMSCLGVVSVRRSVPGTTLAWILIRGKGGFQGWCGSSLRRSRSGSRP